MINLKNDLKNKTIRSVELIKHGSVANLNEQVNSLINQQIASWPLAEKNYGALSGVLIKEFDFGNFKIIAQCNPERIRSSAAKTDAKTIESRPCFLCLKNLPSEQKGLIFKEKYIILVNPFPIFEKHLTISNFEHTPQLILKFFPDMLEITQELSDFIVFYNGPQCGASAPDHFHFQAVGKGVLPVEKDIGFSGKNGIRIIPSEKYLRKLIVIESGNREWIISEFVKIYNSNIISEEEPMMNVLCSFENNRWRIIIFPRSKQRSSHFFHSGEKQIVVGPAAVEMSGILVLPRPADFEKITKSEIIEIYSEVTLQ
jgi:hypothetical protein